MNSTIYIPNKLMVGFQGRRDTYSGKLAYIIYYDEAGKLRKEPSWNNWRDDKIEPMEIANEPMSGFVLNKKVGGYSSGWDYRNSYIRIYDPRGFEFEITVENLLFILENTSCIKGKGLEGEFIYGWDKTELVLIPVCSSEYKKIRSYTDLIEHAEVIKNRDLVPGRTYLAKNGTAYTFLDKLVLYEDGKRKGNRFFFAEIYSYDDEDIRDEINSIDDEDLKDELYLYYKNPTIYIKTFSDCNNRFIKVVDYNTHPKFKYMIYKMKMNREYCSSPDIEIVYKPYTEEEFRNKFIENKDIECYLHFKKIFGSIVSESYSQCDITYENGNISYDGNVYTVNDFMNEYMPARRDLVNLNTKEIIEYDYPEY